MNIEVDDDKVYEVATRFIDGIMYDLLYDEAEIANVSFDFREWDARSYLKTLILESIDKNITEKSKIFYALDNIDYSKPVIEVSNYKLLFNLLFDYIYKLSTVDENKDTLEQFWLNTAFTFKYIWLRMTPDDFKNPELFLYKSVCMLNDNTFIDYNKKKVLDDKIDDKYNVCVLDRYAAGYDESPKEVLFSLFRNNEANILPVVRYGIYEENNNKVCEIGSIQDKDSKYNKSIYPGLDKSINRFKYKLNDGVDNLLIQDIKFNKLLSLLLFIKLLKSRDINYIRVPSMYVLDYEYHEKFDKRIKFEFENRWDRKVITPDECDKLYLEYLSRINKQDFISKAKTTDFIRLFERLIYHIDDVDILSYPMDTSSYFDFKINSYDNVRGKTIKKILK